MKKIAFFTPGLKIGGIERVFLTYAEAFLQKGDEVSYVICKEDGVLISGLNPKLNIISLGDRQLRNSIIPLYRYFKSNPVDYFITGSIVANALSILLCKIARSKTKVIVSHHNYFNIEQQSIISKLIIRFLYNKAHRIFSVSSGITQLLLTQKVKPTLLKTIYNPISIESIHLESEELNQDILPERYILFLGRLGEVKNLHFLLDSFAKLRIEEPNIDLVILGEGPLRESLINKANVLGLSDHIHFLKARSNPFPIVKKALLVALPSLSEALPTVILESFTLGKTVVATPTNGALDLLENGKFGYISTTFDDTSEFAKLLEIALREPLPSTLLEDRAQQFDIQTKLKELESLFDA